MKSTYTIILLFVNLFLSAQNNKLDTLIEEYAGEHNFNGTILIEKDDVIMHYKSYGLSNIEFDIPNTKDTRYKIASITKLFTSVLIYQLVEEGRLKLENHIVDFLPNYKGEGKNNVTIQHLLTSTSGIQNLEKNGDIVYEKRLTTDEILDQYASGHLEFTPGTRFSYNNADYIILGKIIEKIYDAPFQEVLKKKILEPLKMKNSGVLNRKVVKNLAQSYWYNESTITVERDIPYFIENYFSSGAMFSTAHDLKLFAKALFNYEIIKKETLNTLLKPLDKANDAEGYASGLWTFSFESENTLNNIASRPGNIWGTEAMLQRFIEKKISIVIVSNGMGTSNMWEMLRKIQPYLD